MMTSTTQREWKAEQESKGLSEHDRLKRLAPGNERLKMHMWTDEELQKIPEDLVQFAFENSEMLQQEFGAFPRFETYRKTLVAGVARVAGVTR